MLACISKSIETREIILNNLIIAQKNLAEKCRTSKDVKAILKLSKKIELLSNYFEYKDINLMAKDN